MTKLCRFNARWGAILWVLPLAQLACTEDSGPEWKPSESSVFAQSMMVATPATPEPEAQPGVSGSTAAAPMPEGPSTGPQGGGGAAESATGPATTMTMTMMEEFQRRDPLPLDDPDVQTCIQRGIELGTPPTCAECTCQYCKPEADRVYLAEDPSFAERAQGLISCGLRTCCAATSCYCQRTPDGQNTDLAACVANPQGPCIDEVHEAAGEEGIVLIQGPCEQDETNPCFAARSLGLCTTGDPAPLPPNQPVEGHCTEACQMCGGAAGEMPDAGMPAQSPGDSGMQQAAADPGMN